MIFPKVKRAVVKYIIDTDHSKETTGFIPKGLFLNIQKHSSATEIGCPATNSANNKFFNILSPISFDLVFGCDEFNTPYWRYEFDTTKHKDIGSKNSVRKILDNTISLSSDKEEKSLQAQFTLPYAFVTDVEDTSLTLLPPHNIKYENCFFATGEFIFTDWIRHLTSAWVLEDKNKEAVVHFEVGEPCMSVYFNKQINLSYMEPTETVKNYMNQMTSVTQYRTNTVNSLFEDIKSRRPKRLLGTK